jgi:hypothetical protein
VSDRRSGARSTPGTPGPQRPGAQRPGSQRQSAQRQGAQRPGPQQGSARASGAGRTDYPGADLGLPEAGPGAIAGLGRRLGALFIDWLLCELIALTLVGSTWWTLLIFAAETWLLTSFTGFTVGKRIVRIRVIRLDGKPVGPLWGLLRTILLLAVIPPVVFDSDQRGLHDKAANTVVVRV